MEQTDHFDSMDVLIKEIQYLSGELNQIRARVHDIRQMCIENDVSRQISLICELFQMKNVIKSLYVDLTRDLLPDPLIDANHIWKTIETHSSSPEEVVQGIHLLEQYFKLKMYLTIDPADYDRTIPAYLKWQEETVKRFVRNYKEKPETDQQEATKYIWNWNNRPNEPLFFGGAARPLHLKTVTAFSSQMSIYYDTLWPVFKDNRYKLAKTLDRLMKEECEKYWPDYQFYPSSGSQSIVDKCLQYFFFHDRDNTWFINSSASDYIPFVHSAREIFADKFIGSKMTSPDEHNTDWILNYLIDQCSSIDYHSNQAGRSTMVILLTSKNRFGRRIDVDMIHNELKRRFPRIVTLVDGCQDGETFKDVDIIVYSKRFTTTGALGVVNKEFLSKHPFLGKKLTTCTSFPVGIIAQIYINMFMINLDLVHGVDELLNAAWWNCWRCPMTNELHSTFEYTHCERGDVHVKDGPIEYSFTEDFIGTILLIKSIHHDQRLLTKLWALLKKQGHAIDCFAMDNPFLSSKFAITSETIRELINRKFIDELRRIEAESSDYLAWPLVPFWVTSPEQISIEILNQNFDICYRYHNCLRVSIGRCGYPGKLTRLVNHIQVIFETGELDISDAELGTHASQWPN